MLLRREQRLQLIVRGERCRRWRNGRSHHHPLLEVALAPSGQWATHRVLEADASDAITGCCLCDARVHEGQLPGIIGEQAAQHLLGLEVLLRTIGGVADMPPVFGFGTLIRLGLDARGDHSEEELPTKVFAYHPANGRRIRLTGSRGSHGIGHAQSERGLLPIGAQRAPEDRLRWPGL